MVGSTRSGLTAGMGAQGLRHARTHDGMRWQKNATVQARTCECCWQSLLHHRGTLWVMYRGNAPRDMLLSTLTGGATTWQARGTAGKFDWDFKGCPHTGGTLAAGANTNTLHSLAWTGAVAAQRLHHVVSRDGGAVWAVAQRLGTPDAQRADISPPPIKNAPPKRGVNHQKAQGGGRFLYCSLLVIRCFTM